jgi:hypothetical protein
VDLTLGVLAHRGGLLVRRPELTVGVVQLTAIGSALSIELFGVATGPLADTLSARPFPPPPQGNGPSLAVAKENDAFWISAHEGTSTRGGPRFDTVQEFITRRPDGDTLDLIVAWPQADLPNAWVRIPCTTR